MHSNYHVPKSHSHRFCNLFQLICGKTGIFFNFVNWFFIFEHHFCKGQIFLFYTLFHALFDALFNTLFNKCFSKITHILHLAFKFFCHGNAEIILKTGFLCFRRYGKRKECVQQIKDLQITFFISITQVYDHNFHKVIAVRTFIRFPQYRILYCVIAEDSVPAFFCRIRTDPDAVDFLEFFIMFSGKDSPILFGYHSCAVIETSCN